MKQFSVLPTCLRKYVNLNNSFVPHCVKIHRLIQFYYADLAKNKQKKSADSSVFGYDHGR